MSEKPECSLEFQRAQEDNFKLLVLQQYNITKPKYTLITMIKQRKAENPNIWQVLNWYLINYVNDFCWQTN